MALVSDKQRKRNLFSPASSGGDDKLARQRKQADQTKRDASAAMGERVRPPNWDVSRSVTGKAAAPAAPKPKMRPAMPAMATAPKPKMRPAAPAAPKPKAKPVTFSGNWKGAASTEMQKRAGARTDRGGGILGALKRMRKP